MKVLKFGGSSVAKAERIQQVKDIIKNIHEKEDKLVIVVSALGGVTDMLLNTAKRAVAGDEHYREMIDDLRYRHRRTAESLFNEGESKAFLSFLKEKIRNLEKLLDGVFLIKELSPRTLDRVASFGELVSSFMVAQYVQKFLPNVQHADSRTLLKTNSDFMGAKVNFEQTNTNLQAAFSAEKGIYIMGGFIASNEDGITTTLGRGGSDYTAAIVGAALDANEIQIWTDVNGVLTADPRKVKKAFSLQSMTYEEALEMSHFGAKVIHPPTVQPALDKQIPIRIKNTFQPDSEGTFISTNSQDNRPVKGISSISQIALLSVQGSGLIGVTGIAGRLFNALSKAKVNIILITQASSEHSICFAVKPNDAETAKTAIEQEFAFEMRDHLIEAVSIENDLCVVAIIGSNMKNTIGISGRMFQALAKNGVNVRAIAQGSSELNISAVISKTDESKSLNALHEAFFLSDTKSIHLYIVGATGLIGSTLLQQINRQKQYLKDTQSLEMKVVAVTNSRQMFFDDDGIETEDYAAFLEANGEKANLDAFVERMISLNLSNSIFVDCTASQLPTPHYENILTESISIVTPNKIANSGSIDKYLSYKELSRKYRVQFLYETNVGAGLPVISTLKDLLQSGDQIIQIEAVLSGSLSFIFNNFANGERFSEIVKVAKEKGYTEPDPRDDLSGMDVARKVLILAREIGQHIELDDIEVENILPKACNEAATVEEFFTALTDNDAHFEQLRDAAAANGKVLRFLATIQANKTSVALKEVSPDNPFYQLSGSDNMIVFTTARYQERPLVVKGPGAGAEVTAAGVFAEIITTSNYLAK